MHRFLAISSALLLLMLVLPITTTGTALGVEIANQQRDENCQVNPGGWQTGDASLFVEITDEGIEQITWSFPEVCGQTGPQLLLISVFSPPAMIASDCTFTHSFCGPPPFGFDIEIVFQDEVTASCQVTPTVSSGGFPFTCTACGAPISMALTFEPLPNENTTWGSLKSIYR